MRLNILHAALFTPGLDGFWGLPIAFEDEPGCGKSAAVKSYIRQFKDFPCEVLKPGERGEGAFGVVPVPMNGILTYPRPDWTAAFDDGGVIYGDELTTAPPLIQAALLGLLLDRKIGSHQFGPRVRVIAAYNPPELAAGGFDLSAPLANRCGHLKWGAPSVEEHAAYMLRGDGAFAVDSGGERDAKAEELRVSAAWPVAWARAVGLETAFLTRRPELKNKCPKPGDPAASRAWPSDRTWEMATRALASAEVHKLGAEDTETFVEAFVGPGAASELFAFKQQADLPDPAAILDGTATFKHNPSRLDRTAAVLNACAALVTPANAAHRKERAEALWGLMDDLTAARADFDVVVPCMMALTDAHIHIIGKGPTVLARVQPVLKAALGNQRAAR